MTIPQYAWWPDGCPVEAVRPPDCQYCDRLLTALEHQRAADRGDEPATAAGDASLAAFADGGEV